MEKNGFLTIPEGNSDFRIVLAYKQLAHYLQGPRESGSLTGTPMALLALAGAYFGYWALSTFLQSVTPGLDDGTTPPGWLCVLLIFLSIALSAGGAVASIIALTMKKGSLGGISLFINIGVFFITIIFGALYGYSASTLGGSSGRYGLPSK